MIEMQIIRLQNIILTLQSSKGVSAYAFNHPVQAKLLNFNLLIVPMKYAIQSYTQARLLALWNA